MTSIVPSSKPVWRFRANSNPVQFEFSGELQEVFNEGEQMELAAELLEVRDEQELNHFLGNLSSGKQAVRSARRSTRRSGSNSAAS